MKIRSLHRTPHGKGFAREIPLLNVERLRPKIGPESGIDPEQINGTPGKAVGCPHSLAEPRKPAQVPEQASPQPSQRPLRLSLSFATCPSAIATPDILKVLPPIWNSKMETARRVRQRLSTVLEWARAAGFRSGDNPVGLIGDALPRQKKSDRHHAALP